MGTKKLHILGSQPLPLLDRAFHAFSPALHTTPKPLRAPKVMALRVLRDWSKALRYPVRRPHTRPPRPPITTVYKNSLSQVKANKWGQVYFSIDF